MTKPTELKIRYRGKLFGSQWIYSTPRTVPLPIPYISHSEKVGEVLCNPVGVFPYADGIKLLELSGEDGPFVLEEAFQDENNLIEETLIDIDPTSAVIVENPNPPHWQRKTAPEPLSPEIIRKRTNHARLKRGVRKRAQRSDKGVPRPRLFKSNSDSLPVGSQAEIQVEAPTLQQQDAQGG